MSAVVSSKKKKRAPSLRVAKMPVNLKGATVQIEKNLVVVKGKKGTLSLKIHSSVDVTSDGQALHVKLKAGHERENMIAGTTRSHLNNFVKGVTEGFSTKLLLVGVGYKAQISGQKLNLTLGHSHPIAYDLPKEVHGQTPSPTEIILESADKALLGQVCAEIIAFRPTEPYKGKGVRKFNAIIILKETKKKK